MNALLCDICERPIRGSAYELHFIRGEAVVGEGGQSRIVHREGSTMLHLCETCGDWVRAAMDHLRQGHTEAAHARQSAEDAGRRYAA